MLRRDARHHADHRAGQGAAAQCRLVGAQDHRSGQSLDLPHHAERGDAGRRHRDQGLQQAQRAHRRAALREHQCRHRQRQGVQGHVREARRQGRRRDRLRPRRQRLHLDRDARRGPRQGRRDPDLHARRPGPEDHAGAGAGRRGEGRRRRRRSSSAPSGCRSASSRRPARPRSAMCASCSSTRPTSATMVQELRRGVQGQVQRRPDASQRARLRPDHADRRRGEARRQGRAVDPRHARRDQELRRRDRQRRVRQEQPEHQDGHDPLHGDASRTCPGTR